MAVLFEKTKLLTDKQFHYCPGCNHGIIHRLVAEVIDEMNLDGKVIGVAPVGCSVFAYDYFNCDMYEAAHGRAPAVATGVKRAVGPDTMVFTYQGDGDLASIGTAEIVHAAHRGEHGQQRLTRPAQLAHGHLVLEFDAHEQEEDCHKKVVHEQLDRHGDRKAAHAERDGLEQEVMDRLVGVRVGAHHRRERGEHHHRRRDRAVPRDALPQVVACEELALPLGK